MNAQITIKKVDNGMYDDSFSLTIVAENGDHFEVKINELSYEGIKKRFPFLTKEEQQFPSDIREICY